MFDQILQLSWEQKRKSYRHINLAKNSEFKEIIFPLPLFFFPPLHPPSTAVECPPLSPPSHGLTTPPNCSPLFYQMSCWFSCQEGYQLAGSSLLTCGEEGKWSHTPPNCQGVVLGHVVLGHVVLGCVLASYPVPIPALVRVMKLGYNIELLQQL